VNVRRLSNGRASKGSKPEYRTLKLNLASPDQRNNPFFAYSDRITSPSIKSSRSHSFFSPITIFSQHQCQLENPQPPLHVYPRISSHLKIRVFLILVKSFNVEDGPHKWQISPDRADFINHRLRWAIDTKYLTCHAISLLTTSRNGGRSHSLWNSRILY